MGVKSYSGVNFGLEIRDKGLTSSLDICFDTSTITDLNRSPKFITVNAYEDTRSIEVRVDGFDSIEKSKDGRSFLSGDISLLLTNKDGLVDELKIHSPSFLIPDDNSKNKNKALSDFRLALKREIEDSFSVALSRLHTKDSSTIRSGGMDSIKGIFSHKQSGVIFKLIATLLIMAIAYASLATIDRVKSVSKSSNPIDPTKLVDDHDQMMNKALRDMGINPEKIKNDMSCFAE